MLARKCFIRDVTWASWRPKSPTARLFVYSLFKRTATAIQKLHITVHCERNSLAILTGCQSYRKRFHIMTTSCLESIEMLKTGPLFNIKLAFPSWENLCWGEGIWILKQALGYIYSNIHWFVVARYRPILSIKFRVTSLVESIWPMIWLL